MMHHRDRQLLRLLHPRHPTPTKLPRIQEALDVFGLESAWLVSVEEAAWTIRTHFGPGESQREFQIAGEAKPQRKELRAAPA